MDMLLFVLVINYALLRVEKTKSRGKVKLVCTLTNTAFEISTMQVLGGGSLGISIPSLVSQNVLNCMFYTITCNNVH